MEYYMNFNDDAVVKVGDDGKRYAKVWDGCNHITPTGEFLCTKDSKMAYGGESFGYFHILEPITKELYETFGVTWGFSESGKIVPIEETQEYKNMMKERGQHDR